MPKEIIVNDNEIIFNNIVINNPPYSIEIESLLNKKPSRIVNNNNIILVYDDEGLYFYTNKKQNSEISQIDIQMEIQSWLDFAPYSVYTGKLYIRGNEIKSLNDILRLGDDILNTDELEGDGNIKVFLNQVCLDITIDSDAKSLQNISIWYL